jgi:hypothetical protein
MSPFQRSSHLTERQIIKLKFKYLGKGIYDESQNCCLLAYEAMPRSKNAVTLQREVLPPSSWYIMMMEAGKSSETSVSFHHNLRGHTPEEQQLLW